MNSKLHSIIFNLFQIILALIVFLLFILISISNDVGYLNGFVIFFIIISLLLLIISFKKKILKLSAIILNILWLLIIIISIESLRENNKLIKVDEKYKDNVVINRKKCKTEETIQNTVSCSLPIIRDDGAHGTGFSVYQGFLITNRHVIANANKLHVFLDPQSLEMTEVKLWNYSDATDIAILKLPVDIPTCKWFPSQNLKLAEDLYAVGWSTDTYGQASVKKGIFSRYNPNFAILGTDTYMTYVETDANINPGNSGSALINECGVVGVMRTERMDDYGNYYDGNASAIGSEKLMNLIIRLIKTGNENKEIPKNNNI